MKRKKAIMWALVLAVLLLASCAGEEVQEDALLASFPKENAPSQMVETDDYWVSLVNEYGGAEYQLSVSSEADQLHPVYSAKDVRIWFLEADNSHVVWCEASDAAYEYKVYSMDSGKVETLFRADAALGFQNSNVGLWGDWAYYAFVDYEGARADIFRQSLLTGEREAVYSFDWQGEYSVMSFSVEGGLLTAAAPAGIAVVDLADGDILLERELPEDVGYVFDISYDSTRGLFGLYYADADSEDIGIIGKDELSIRSVFTFSRNCYAYHDTIRCAGGHLYWIAQANATGNVTDHYILVDYNYLNDARQETERTFGFWASESGVYYLRFDRDGAYENIELYER